MINMQNGMPSFSVLISVYRKEKPEYFNEALLSLEKQTILPEEIIVVEDGKLTPKLEKVLKKHENKNIVKYKIVKLSKNLGLASALNFGTQFVKTEWIARMDSDDYSVPNRFEKQLRIIKDNPDIVVVGGQVKEFSENITNIVGYRKVPTEMNLIQTFIKWRNPFNHPTVMINKKVLEKVGGYKKFGNLEDYYLWSRLVANNYEVCNIPDYLTLMRVDEGMYTRRGKIKNIKYFYKLRSFLRRQGIINRQEEYVGDALMTINIIIPTKLRKIIYQKLLHA